MGGGRLHGDADWEPITLTADITPLSRLVDIVCAIGISSTIKLSTAFLGELRRIKKDDGT